MFNSKYSNFLTILLIVVIVAIVGLLGYLGFNYFRDIKIDKEAAEYVESFESTTEQSQNVIITGQNVIDIPSAEDTQVNEIIENTEVNSTEENIVEVEDVNSTGGSSGGTGQERF